MTCQKYLMSRQTQFAGMRIKGSSIQKEMSRTATVPLTAAIWKRQNVIKCTAGLFEYFAFIGNPSFHEDDVVVQHVARCHKRGDFLVNLVHFLMKAPQPHAQIFLKQVCDIIMVKADFAVSPYVGPGCLQHCRSE